jgi:hypothetical protein
MMIELRNVYQRLDGSQYVSRYGYRSRHEADRHAELTLSCLADDQFRRVGVLRIRENV